MIERIGREEIGVNYDTVNCQYSGGVKGVDDLPSIVPYVAHVHLKDGTGGKGVWDFHPSARERWTSPGVLAILEYAGFRGPISVEIECQGEPWPPLDEVDRAMASSFGYLSSLGLS